MSWDAIVVGTGMGGATLGYALARGGAKVLFLERGRRQRQSGARSIVGRSLEDHLERSAGSGEPRRDVFERAGRAAGPLELHGPGSHYRFSPVLGSGTGGSSALYGMLLERFLPEDFEPGRHHRPAPGVDLPDRWPITYEELRPCYARAERMYRVRGTPDPAHGGHRDPLPPPPELSPASREVFDFLEARGLHPYHPPMACDYVEGCRECLAFLCDRDCKNDSDKVALRPALERYGARLLDRCEVQRLEASDTRVTQVVCTRGGRTQRLRADRVVLAAGAIESPGLLLRSRSGRWPDGLANSSGLVGRNLMRHLWDVYCIRTRRPLRPGDLAKQVACTDLYLGDGEKLGLLHAVGRLPAAATLVSDAIVHLRNQGRPVLAGACAALRPLVRSVVERRISNRIVLTALLEDLPRPDNRVTLDGAGRLHVHYTIGAEDARRLALLRRKMRELLRSCSYTFVSNAENNEHLGHACGTLRFGDDPETSVLDRHNRAHGLENLYVVDASCFPSSSGMNPSLTIAANALRVADQLLDQRLELPTQTRRAKLTAAPSSSMSSPSR